MYTIAENEITTVNGLGDTAVPASVLPSESSSTKASGSGIDWTSVINTGLQQGSNIAQTAINAHNQTGNSNTNNGGNYAGGDPATYTPSTRTYNTNTSGNTNKGITDFLPWIIGGVAVVGLMFVMMSNNDKKR